MRFAFIVATFCAFHSANLTCNKSVQGDAVGSWGGQHASLQVSDNGARLELDCAHGEISGPVRKDENSSAQSARYIGHIDGDTMTLKIVRGQQESGPFTLTRNAQPR